MTRSLVMFLVSHEDGDTDTLQAFAEDTAHILGPAYVGIIDYAVRVDVPSCFVLDGSNAAKEAVDEILDAIEPDPWRVRTRADARERPVSTFH